MRKAMACLLVTVGALTSAAGCVMNLGVRDYDDDRRVVEIDGELYVVDVDKRCAKKIEMDSVRRVDETTRTEIETRDK